MTGEPVWLTQQQATVLLEQFRESADYRGWQLLAVAVMANHFHLVVRTLNDVDPDKLLQTFKAYGSRALTLRFGRPVSSTWWTKSGSKRKLPNEVAVRTAIDYVLTRQHEPLVVWPNVSDPEDGEPAT